MNTQLEGLHEYRANLYCECLSKLSAAENLLDRRRTHQDTLRLMPDNMKDIVKVEEPPNFFTWMYDQLYAARVAKIMTLIVEIQHIIESQGLRKDNFNIADIDTRLQRITQLIHLDLYPWGCLTNS